MSDMEKQIADLEGYQVINETNAFLNEYVNPMIEKAESRNEKPLIVIAALFETIRSIIDHQTGNKDEAIKHFEVFSERLIADWKE